MTKEAAIKLRELRKKIKEDLDSTFEHLRGAYLELDGILEGLENVNNTLEKKDE